MDHHLESRIAELERRVADLEGNKIATHNTAVVPQSVNATEHSSTSTSVENFIGGRVLLRAGVFALLIAVGFFLKYAFEQHLLTDGAKVLVIALFGAIMIGIGEYFSRKHPLFGQVLSGCGIAVWFFDVVAARVLYGFLSPVAALIVALALTVIMLAYSWKRESQPLLIAALTGAYLAPLFDRAGSVSSELEFAVYALIITAGALWFLQRRSAWTMYMIAPIVGFTTHIIVNATNGLAIGYASIIVLLEFLIATWFIIRAWNRAEKGADGPFPVLIFQVVGTLLATQVFESLSSQQWMIPSLLVVCAVFATAGAGWLHTLDKRGAAADLFGITAVLYAAVSVANYFSNDWRVYVWLLIVVVVAGVAAIASRAVIAIAAFGLTIVSWWYFVFGNAMNVGRSEPVWLSSTVLLFIFLILVLIYQSWLSKFQKYRPAAARFIGIGAFIFAELTGVLFMMRQIDLLTYGEQENIATSIGLILYGAANVVIGFLKRARAFRVVGLVVLGIAVLKVAFVDLWDLGTLYRIAVSFVLGVLLVVSSLLYHKYADKTK